MLLELREVSRKTPRDGRLEITAETFRRLSVLGSTIPLRLAETIATASLDAMDCQCGANGALGHRHHFLQAPPLATLPVGETIALSLEGGTVIVDRPHALRPA